MSNIKLFNNIIFYQGEFYTLKDDIKECNLHNKINLPWKPKDFNIIKEVIKNKKIKQENTPCILLQGFHSNMGHLLWDFMYPSWYSMYCLMNSKCMDPFKWITIDDEDSNFGGWHTEIINKFSGESLQSINKMKHLYGDSPILFNELIVGIDNIGLQTVQKNFLCKMKFDNDITDPVDIFVNRMYNRYNIKRNKLTKNQKHSVLFVNSRRKYTNYDEMYEKIKKKFVSCDIKNISWENYEKDFETQLNMINNTSIIVVSTGTARSRGPFLPHGAIEIQTLYNNSKNSKTNLLYYDFYFGTLSQNIKIMNIPYYTNKEVENNLCSGLISEYIEASLSIIPVNTPVNKFDNIPSQLINIQKNIQYNDVDFYEWKHNFLEKEEILLKYDTPSNICIIPICGYASRIGNIPKFMLPIKDNSSLLKNTVTMCKNNFFNCSIITTPDHGTMVYNYLLRHSLLDNTNVSITETKTMSETVLKGKNDKNVLYSLLMPDTYFQDNEVLKKLNQTYDRYNCDVVVGIFKIKKEQVGKLGQVSFDEKNNLLDVIDKNTECTYEWAWGSILWNYKFFNYIDEKESHIGYALPKIIKDPTMSVKVVKLDGYYYDCGTINEYKNLLNMEL